MKQVRVSNRAELVVAFKKAVDTSKTITATPFPPWFWVLWRDGCERLRHEHAPRLCYRVLEDTEISFDNSSNFRLTLFKDKMVRKGRLKDLKRSAQKLWI